MSNVKSPTPANQLNSARNNPDLIKGLSVVGPRPPRRPVTRFFQLSVIAGAIWAGGRLLSGVDEAAHSPSLDASIQAPPAVSHSSPQSSRFDNVKGGFSGTLSSSPAVSTEQILAPISADLEDSHNDIVRKYQATGMTEFETAFQALSVQAEGIELTPYNAGENSDPANITIGVGYHIPSNLRQLGRQGVIDEFLAAGISQDVAQDLVSEDPQRLDGVKITPNQGLSLLVVSMPRYKNDVISRLGERNWKKLGTMAGPEGQAGVVWSAYNGAFWQHAHQTIQAIETGNRLEVAQSIYGTAKIGGKSRENHNLSLARAAVASRDTFHYAVGYGNRQGADRRVSSLVAQSQPPLSPELTPLPQPDFIATGEMMAVDVIPPTPTRPTHVNVGSFNSSSTDDPEAQPSNKPPGPIR